MGTCKVTFSHQLRQDIVDMLMADCFRGAQNAVSSPARQQCSSRNNDSPTTSWAAVQNWKFLVALLVGLGVSFVSFCSCSGSLSQCRVDSALSATADLSCHATTVGVAQISVFTLGLTDPTHLPDWVLARVLSAALMSASWLCIAKLFEP